MPKSPAGEKENTPKEDMRKLERQGIRSDIKESSSQLEKAARILEEEETDPAPEPKKLGKSTD